MTFLTPALHAAAGSLLVSEGGATLSDIGGGPWTLGADSMIVAANHELHGELVDLARTSAPESS